MRKAIAAAFFASCLGLQAQEAILDANFGDAKTPIPSFDAKGAKKGHIAGVLPEGWSENSSGWCDVTASLSPVDDNGQKFLRIDVKEVKSGQLQLCAKLPEIKERSCVKITLKRRSSEDGAIEFGVRYVGYPYSFLGRSEAPESEKWSEETLLFMMEKAAQPVGVWLNVSKPCSIDIASVKVERMDLKQYVEQSRKEHPDGGPANLLANPVLPLGLQTGWLLERSISDEEAIAAPDPAVVGPSGCPALKLESLVPGKAAIIMGDAFKSAFLPETHRLSIRCKGQSGVALQLTRDGKVVASKNFPAPGGEWKVLSLDYQPEPLCSIEKIKLICNKGPVWIDAWEACPKSKAGAFAIKGGCLVALALPSSEASCSRIQFEDEKPLAIYKCFGEIEGASLKAKVVNLYGEEFPLVPSNGTIDFGAALKNKPYGCFRIEAWLERDGKTVSTVSELPVYRLRRPVNWGKDAPESPFGVHTLSATRHIKMAKAAGANWTRLHDAGLEYIGWWMLEEEKGKWTFFDKEINRYREGSLLVFGELGTAPKWASYYSGSGLKTFGYFDKFFQPKDLADFENYVEVVAKRYKGTIDAWDVWNEPWNPAWWGVAYDHSRNDRYGYQTSKEPQKDFASLMKSAYSSAKQANPKAYVLGFNSSSGGGGNDFNKSGYKWTEGVLDNGGLDACDALSYHEYQTNPMPGAKDDPIVDGIKMAMGPVYEKYGKLPKPLWMTEGSCFSADTSIVHLDYGLYKNSLPFVNKDPWMKSSDTLAKYMISMLSNGVSKFFLYSMHGFNGSTAMCTILVTPDGQMHPNGAAHSAFAYFIEGRKFVKTLPFGESYAFIFEGRGGAVAAISGNKRVKTRKIAVPAGAKAFDLFGNPAEKALSFDGKVCYLLFKNAADAEKALAQ